MKFLGIDIGGANIKLADSEGYASTVPFALWREPERLTVVLAECLQSAPYHEAVAATTTGELADCFATKREGIATIYRALQRSADGRAVKVYLTDGTFVSPEEAIAAPHRAAASNWHTLATFAARYIERGEGLLIDIGSTTTDIIPVRDGKPSARGRTDTERLLHGELVYTGVTRTPVGMLVSELPWRGELCPIARELFATTLDAHLMLGNIAENPEQLDAADGRPAIRAAASDRLARMVGADRESFDEQDALLAAEAIATAQRRAVAQGLRQALSRDWSPIETIVLSGQGEFLARQVLDELGLVRARRVSLADRLGPGLSQAATAHALAVLAGSPSRRDVAPVLQPGSSP